MDTHFNKLTPAEAERLAMLAEECGEVIQVIGKILRHGYDSYHPADPQTTNRQLLGRELTDLYAVASSLSRDSVPKSSLHAQKQAWARKLRYVHHQEEIDDAVASGDLIPRADAAAAQAALIKRAADAIRSLDPTENDESSYGMGLSSGLSHAEDIVLALVPADALAEVQRMRTERDAALARVDKLRHQITEASDPDFIWGALDNVHDAETTLDDYAAAVSRAIRAALSEAAR